MNTHLFVLDASAVSRCVLSPTSLAAKQLDRLTSEKKNAFISPKLFLFEFGNIVRYNTPSEEVSRQIIEACSHLPINFLDVLIPDIYKILSISWELKLTFYDCSYLHFALLHDCLLLTCDKKFFQAASHLGHIELWD